MVTHVQTVPAKYPRFRLENRVLDKHFPPYFVSIMSKWKPVFPSANRKEILRLYDEGHIADYFEVAIILSRVAGLYYRSGLRKLVDSHVKRYLTLVM